MTALPTFVELPDLIAEIEDWFARVEAGEMLHIESEGKIVARMEPCEGGE